MDKILALLIAAAMTAQAYILPGTPGSMSSRVDLGNLYNNNPVGFTDYAGGVAGSVASSLNGLGNSLGGLGGSLGGLNGLGGLGSPLSAFGGPLTVVGGHIPRNVGGLGGLVSPRGYGASGVGVQGYGNGGIVQPQPISLDYGYFRGG